MAQQQVPVEKAISLTKEVLEHSCRNKLLNISIVSAEAKDFITVKRKSSEEPLLIRPTLHITQITPFGELKTTTANRIEKHIKENRAYHPYYKVSSVTAPAIAGSIDEKFKVIPPVCTNFQNGTVIVDEFKTNSTEKSEAIGAALDVLENEESSRAIARTPKKSLKSLAQAQIQYEVKDGRLHFWGLRCNWIFLTAKHLEMNRSLPMAMLLSRTVPIKFTPSKLETIDNPSYLEIRDYVEKHLRENSVPPNYFFRTINDCVRAYVFSSYEHNWELYDYILKNKTMFVSDYEKLGFSLAQLEMQAESEISHSKQAKTS